MGPLLQQQDRINRQWGKSVYLGVMLIIKVSRLIGYSQVLDLSRVVPQLFFPIVEVPAYQAKRQTKTQINVKPSSDLTKV
jgi:hypothetical protein